MFYRSERLFLRPAFPEDSRAVYDAICDAGIVSMLATPPWPYRIEDAEQFCARPAEDGEARFLVTLPSDGGRVIGCIGFGSRDQKGEPELGYWIARDFWGRGYATEAGRGACEVARSLGHDRLVASHYLDNPASGRVLRKIGFVETGEIRSVRCRARGGEAVLARRFALDLARGDRSATLPRVQVA